MRLTRHTDYALRLLIYLAAVPPDAPATAPAVARAYGISPHHMAKIAHRLGRLGYVHTRRGRGGGLALARPTDAINLGVLVREMEATLAVVECFDDPAACPIEPACGLKRVLAEARDAFLAELDRRTLADLVRKPGRLTDLLVWGEPPRSPGGKRPARAGVSAAR